MSDVCYTKLCIQLRDSSIWCHESMTFQASGDAVLSENWNSSFGWGCFFAVHCRRPVLQTFLKVQSSEPLDCFFPLYFGERAMFQLVWVHLQGTYLHRVWNSFTDPLSLGFFWSSRRCPCRRWELVSPTLSLSIDCNRSPVLSEARSGGFRVYRRG